jgi:hypothetical protein
VKLHRFLLSPHCLVSDLQPCAELYFSVTARDEVRINLYNIAGDLGITDFEKPFSNVIYFAAVSQSLYQLWALLRMS